MTENCEPGPQKVAHHFPAHFCLAKTPSIAIWGILFFRMGPIEFPIESPFAPIESHIAPIQSPVLGDETVPKRSNQCRRTALDISLVSVSICMQHAIASSAFLCMNFVAPNLRHLRRNPTPPHPTPKLTNYSTI